MQTKDQEIGELRRKIEKLESEAQTLEKEAHEFEQRAKQIEKESERSLAKSIFGFIGVVVGVVLIPVTLGTSISIAVAGGAYAGINLNNAVDCMRAAKIAKGQAEEKRDEAAKLRAKEKELQK